MPRFSPEEDAALLPYVDRLCRWDDVLPLLNGRSHIGAVERLRKLRRRAGTLWTIDQREWAREMARSRPRANGKFV